MGIYIAATVTTILSLAIVGRALLRNAPRQEWKLLVWVAILHLPLSALALAVRIPIDAAVRSVIASADFQYHVIASLYAPLTEEPAKLWLLLIPWFWKKLSEHNPIRVALAIGLGFGIGEAWAVIPRLVANPTIADLPWYMLGGYMGERLMVCIYHGVFTAAALRTVRQAPLRGIALAMLLHWAANFPITLMELNVFGIGRGAWLMLVQLWLALFLLLLLTLLARWCGVTANNLTTFPEAWARCPECGHVYQRSTVRALNCLIRNRIIGWNQGYGECPKCGKACYTNALEGSVPVDRGESN